MDVTAGRYTFGSQTGTLLVKTTRTGLGAKAGHDLTIEVTRWRGEAVVNAADPTATQVTVEADADSFEVREGVGGIKPLTPSDSAEIKKNIQDKVLHTDRYKTIVFRSARVEGTADAFQIHGDLTIADSTGSLTVRGGVSGDRVTGEAVVVQSRWGIKPYSAFFGALKLNDAVEVRFDVGLAPEG
ncbi:polyisoprenoid-binding protein YceI [Thermocatellispora tengchongensis]|uniref:Polyisoprenoid-binding protein YceI n=1 Tax=Thermocatellispora tengchongensis TaxID=1073253 RepID=A0A840P8I6_9ACTN|nr:YceI family protein [Thermocatellispora tengchongensis]MBB5134233.1 polyisoprenoid-binding protein YceI [Thermocatellispora tengchongensis]